MRTCSDRPSVCTEVAGDIDVHFGVALTQDGLATHLSEVIVAVDDFTANVAGQCATIRARHLVTLTDADTKNGD